jgi:hypothetical protein
MSVSSIGSTTSTFAAQRSSGSGSDVRNGIKALSEAVKSGDMTAVKAAYDTLSKLQESNPGASDSDNPLTKLVTNVGKAIETGDVSQVQAAMEASRPSGAQGAQGGPPPGGGPQGGPPPGEPPSDEMVQAVGELGSSLQAGDLDSAKSAYSSLLSLLGEDDEDSEDDSSSSASSSTSATDRLQSLLSDLGSALESGNLSSAQQAFSALAPRGSQGVDTYA